MRRFLRKCVKAVLIIILLSFVVLLVFRHKYQHAIFELAETQIRNSTSDLINDAIDKQIDI